MLEGINQYEATVQPDGTVKIPPLLLEALRWRPGMNVLMEHTDEGLLITHGLQEPVDLVR